MTKLLLTRRITLGHFMASELSGPNVGADVSMEQPDEAEL